MKYKCRYCGDDFTSKEKIKSIDYQLCPYCYAVKHGEPDAKWLPSVKGDEVDRKGFHKI